MKAIILFTLVASANAFAATNSNDNVSAPPAVNCTANLPESTANKSRDAVAQEVAMDLNQSKGSNSSSLSTSSKTSR